LVNSPEIACILSSARRPPIISTIGPGMMRIEITTSGCGHATERPERFRGFSSAPRVGVVICHGGLPVPMSETA
jgi:hypothetical protein